MRSPTTLVVILNLLLIPAISAAAIPGKGLYPRNYPGPQPPALPSPPATVWPSPEPVSSPTAKLPPTPAPPADYPPAGSDPIVPITNKNPCPIVDGHSTSTGGLIGVAIPITLECDNVNVPVLNDALNGSLDGTLDNLLAGGILKREATSKEFNA